jgi:hypothetical protein
LAPREDYTSFDPSDSGEELYKLTALDYLTACAHNNYTLLFRLDDAHTEKPAAALDGGLERTLKQGCQYIDTIQKVAEYPSVDEIEQITNNTLTLGDLNTWSVAPMTYGEKLEAHLDNRPAISDRPSRPTNMCAADTSSTCTIFTTPTT